MMKTRMLVLCLSVILMLSCCFGLSLAAEAEPLGENTGLTWSLSESGELTIFGNGAMPDFAKPEDAPWYAKRNQILRVIFRGAVTHIGDYAFSDCENLFRIVFPSTLRTIGMYSFEKWRVLSWGNDVDEEYLDDPVGSLVDGRLLGDINADGVVDGLDAIRLMKWLAGEEDIEISEENADISQNGIINELDLVRLLKYLARQP